MPPDTLRHLRDHAPRTWQRMLSGRRLNLLEPSPLDIEMRDVALGLSRNMRWNGQTEGPNGLSVAQHCVFVADIVCRLKPASPTWVQMAALLHDAPEFVTHDLITPLKAVVGDVFREVEARLQVAIHQAAGLPAHLPVDTVKLIKRADRIAAATEAVQLAGFAASEVRTVLKNRERPLSDITLAPQTSRQAEEAFLGRYNRLWRAMRRQS